MRGGCFGVLSALAVGFVLLAASSQAQFAYVANGGGSNNVSAYSIGENGALTAIPGSPFAAGNLPSSVVVDPSARFAYVVNEGGNNVSAYTIDKNGALTPIPGSPFAAETDPHEVAVDPAGKFAYVTNAVSNNVSAYRIGENGALTPIPGSPFAAESFPGQWQWTLRASFSTRQIRSATTSRRTASVRTGP